MANDLEILDGVEGGVAFPLGGVHGELARVQPAGQLVNERLDAALPGREVVGDDQGGSHGVPQSMQAVPGRSPGLPIPGGALAGGLAAPAPPGYSRPLQSLFFFLPTCSAAWRAAARLSRSTRVSGCSSPSTRTRSARVASNSGTASPSRPAAR